MNKPVLALMSVLLSGSVAHAEYPERTITIINPFSAAGTSDNTIRTMALYLRKCLGGADIIVVSRGGAGGGGVGFADIAKSAPSRSCLQRRGLRTNL